MCHKNDISLYELTEMSSVIKIFQKLHLVQWRKFDQFLAYKNNLTHTKQRSKTIMPTRVMRCAQEIISTFCLANCYILLIELHCTCIIYPIKYPLNTIFRFIQIIFFYDCIQMTASTYHSHKFSYFINSRVDLASFI